ncbi:ZN296-like protein, partial [Mya arenaria]
MATDYLTCGSCLREFPLQQITTFIQHKKLDCDDEVDQENGQSELQCNYCPQGFMTAWALLVHAQITHNLKIFLENASKSIFTATRDVNSNRRAIEDIETDTGVLERDKLKLKICDSAVLDNVPVTGNSTETQVLFPSSSNETSAVVPKNVTEVKCSKLNLVLVDNSTLRKISTEIPSMVIKSATPMSDTSVENIVPHNDMAVTQSKPTLQITIVPKLSQTSSSLDNKTYLVSQMGYKNQPTLFKSSNLMSQAGNLSQPTTLNTSNVINTFLSKKVCLSKDLATKEVQKSQLVPIQPKPSFSTPKIQLSSLQVPFKLATTEPLLSTETSPTFKTNMELKLHDDAKNASTHFDSGAGPSEINSSVSAESDETDEQMDARSDQGCCSNQGCGVTIIPGSHENLQKCCNAVVPKKRKLHMEQKHMPFAWGSSRYASRKLLYRSKACNAARASASMMNRPQQSSSTIYIDLKPDNFITSDSQSNTDVSSSNYPQSVTCSTSCVESSTLQTNSSGTNKPRSLMLKPGSVFSIPFTYKIPTLVSQPTSTLPFKRVNYSSTLPTQRFVKDQSAGSQIVITDASNIYTNVTTSHGTKPGTREMIRSTILARKAQRLKAENEKSDNTEVLKPFKCEKCTMGFNQRIHLKKHMSKHTGIKPFKCGECSYSTVERSHLKVHIRIHTVRNGPELYPEDPPEASPWRPHVLVYLLPQTVYPGAAAS